MNYILCHHLSHSPQSDMTPITILWPRFGPCGCQHSLPLHSHHYFCHHLLLYYTSITNSSLLSLPFPVGTLPSTHSSISTNLCPILSTSQACLTLKAFMLKAPF